MPLLPKKILPMIHKPMYVLQVPKNESHTHQMGERSMICTRPMFFTFALVSGQTLISDTFKGKGLSQVKQ